MLRWTLRPIASSGPGRSVTRLDFNADADAADFALLPWGDDGRPLLPRPTQAHLDRSIRMGRHDFDHVAREDDALTVDGEDDVAGCEAGCLGRASFVH